MNVRQIVFRTRLWSSIFLTSNFILDLYPVLNLGTSGNLVPGSKDHNLGNLFVKLEQRMVIFETTSRLCAFTQEKDY